MFLIFCLIVFSLSGLILVFKAFYIHTIIHPDTIKLNHNQKKSVFLETVGVCLLFCAGLIIIYFYSQQPSNDRILKQIHAEEIKKDILPDISFQNEEIQ